MFRLTGVFSVLASTVERGQPSGQPFIYDISAVTERIFWLRNLAAPELTASYPRRLLIRVASWSNQRIGHVKRQQMLAWIESI
jgi:hypothetical protein